MVANELLQKLVFAPAPSVFIHAFSVVSVISSAFLGLSEKTGKKHLEYSKFWNATNSPKSASTQKKTQLPSRRGMLFLYVPALLVSVMSLMLFSREDIRVVFLASALAIHFFKRVFETLHAFSITTGTFFYLLGRSFATKRWYMSKFEDFPQDVKALIPCVY